MALTRDDCPPRHFLANYGRRRGRTYSQTMAFSDRQLLEALSRMPFVESTELALILGEPHATVHRRLSELLADGIVAKVTHGTVHLPSSGRYCLTVGGIRETADFLDFDTPSDFVQAYPVSREWLTLLREWLTLLIRRMARWPPSIAWLVQRFQRPHLFFESHGLLHDVIGVIVLLIMPIITGRILNTLQPPSHLPGDVGVSLDRLPSWIWLAPKSLCHDHIAPIIHQSVRQVR